MTIHTLSILTVIYIRVFSEYVELLSEYEENKLDHQDPLSTFFTWKDKNGTPHLEDIKQNVNKTSPKVDIMIYFYSKYNPDKPVIFNARKVNEVTKTNFNPSKESLFIVHGWGNWYNSSVNIVIKEAVLKKHDVNIFVVDWSSISQNELYSTIYKLLPKLGASVGKFIQGITKRCRHRLSKIKMVGYSLGAHIAGIAGKTTKGQIKCIIGLDPAGPLFTLDDVKRRLNKGDAKYVEVSTKKCESAMKKGNVQ
ncbi:hypothetical protein NQ318_013540 [Aromia moschata]|uniref:Lipase domain-containing protein n=1 Tax=Aromia moschata TaxID=1265417 RepID=A0AAV8XZ21_9CUCU|nr:hypothetical protein NQ318_013540 [Aromia moschata]